MIVSPSLAALIASRRLQFISQVPSVVSVIPVTTRVAPFKLAGEQIKMSTKQTKYNVILIIFIFSQFSYSRVEGTISNIG